MEQKNCGVSQRFTMILEEIASVKYIIGSDLSLRNCKLTFIATCRNVKTSFAIRSFFSTFQKMQNLCRNIFSEIVEQSGFYEI